MNEKDPKCWAGGAVGGPGYRLPGDHARYRRNEGDLTCCNRLWCPACKSWVRSADGVRLAAPLSPEDANALYDKLHPEETSFLARGGQGQSFRTYFCRCQAANLIGIKRLEMSNSAWTCGGHPQQP